MKTLMSAVAALGVLFAAQTSVAQTPVATQAPVVAPIAPPVAAKATEAAPIAAAPTTTIGTSAPVDGIGQPVPGGYTIQPQVTENGQYGLWMHDYLLMPILQLPS